MARKIAYFVNQYPKVSHTFIRREIRALEKLGFEIERYALRGWDALLVDEEDVHEQSRTRYVLRDGWLPLVRAALCTLAVHPRRFCRSLIQAVRMGWKADRPLHYHLAYLAEACVLSKWLRSKPASHVHAHFGTNSAEVVLLTRLLGGPTYSFTVHGPEEFEKAPLLHLGDKVAGAAFVVAVSSYGRSELMRWSQPSDWDKIHVVHCGVDAASYGDSSRMPGKARLVCVGRICEQKAQLLLVEAFARIAASGANAELVLVGDGEMRDEVQALIDTRGLTDRVRITGWVDNTRVNEELAGARALVLPSRAEGLPVVIMESMALGRAVISTRVAGIPELVLDGETGWLVPAGDVAALANAMASVLSCPDETLARMGDKGRARVLERHSIDREAGKLAALMRPELTFA